MNRKDGIQELLRDPSIRKLTDDGDDIVLDIHGLFDHNVDQTRHLCNKLIDAGILEFSIAHSY